MSSKPFIECLEFFVIEFYHVRIKYANKICQHAVTKMFHLELVETLCSISKVSISLPWVKVMLSSSA